MFGVADVWVLIPFVDEVAAAVALTADRLARIMGLDRDRLEKDGRGVRAVLDGRFRPIMWSAGASRFARDRLHVGETLPRAFPEYRRVIENTLMVVREMGGETRIEAELHGQTFDATGTVRFVVSPIHEGSRIVGLSAAAERIDGQPVYAYDESHLLMVGGAVASLAPHLGLSPRDGVTAALVRQAARDAVRSEVGRILPVLRGARAARRPIPRVHPEPPPA